MSHSFIDYPSSGPDQGIVKDLSPAADPGTAADAVLGSLKRLADCATRTSRLSDSTCYGVYEPRFMSASGLASVTGTFAVASGGGLIANTSGSQAKGIMNLPVTIDYTKPWRFAALFSYGGDSQNATVQLQNPNDTSYGQVSLSISSGGITLAVGGNNTASLLSGLTAGQNFWFSIASDGNRVCVACIPAGHAGINTNPAYQGAVQQEVYKTFANTYANGAHTPAFTGLSQIVIQTASTSTKIMGVFLNVGSLAGGNDARLQPPAIVPVQVTRPDGITDNTGFVCLPETYTGRGNCDAIHIEHPNASDEQWGLRSGDPDAGAAFASLRSTYIMSFIRGDPLSYTNGYASPWGAANGLAVRKQLFDWMRANLPGIRRINWIGQSAGLQSGLMYSLTYPGELKAVAGISGVANLSAAYAGTNGGSNLSSTIQSVFPTYYVSLQASNTGNAVTNGTYWQQITTPGGKLTAPYATYTNRGAYASGTTYALNDVVLVNASSMSQLADHDPAQRPGAFANLPIKLWHGDSDTTIPLAQSQVFVNAMASIGVTVPLVTVTGAGHLSGAGLWDGTGLQAFFKSST